MEGSATREERRHERIIRAYNKLEGSVENLSKLRAFIAGEKTPGSQEEKIESGIDVPLSEFLASFGESILSQACIIDDLVNDIHPMLFG